MVIGTTAGTTGEAFKIIHLANAVEDQLNWPGVVAYSAAFLLAALISMLAVTVGTRCRVLSASFQRRRGKSLWPLARDETAEGRAGEGKDQLERQKENNPLKKTEIKVKKEDTEIELKEEE